MWPGGRSLRGSWGLQPATVTAKQAVVSTSGATARGRGHSRVIHSGCSRSGGTSSPEAGGRAEPTGSLAGGNMASIRETSLILSLLMTLRDADRRRGGGKEAQGQGRLAAGTSSAQSHKPVNTLLAPQSEPVKPSTSWSARRALAADAAAQCPRARQRMPEQSQPWGGRFLTCT